MGLTSAERIRRKQGDFVKALHEVSGVDDRLAALEAVLVDYIDVIRPTVSQAEGLGISRDKCLRDLVELVMEAVGAGTRWEIQSVLVSVLREHAEDLLAPQPRAHQ